MTKRGDIIILHMYGSWDMEHKSQIFFLTCTINENHMMYGSWDVERDSQNFLSFWAIFDLLPHSQPRKSKLKKKQKNARRYCHFTYVYHKWRSYDVWFLRYGAQQADFFVILDHFLPFYSPNNLGNHEIWSTIKFLSF